VVSARLYDAMYRRGWAPWDAVGVRDELRALLERGEVTPASHPRTIDLGCGTGANVVELADRGFEATGVDLSRVALEQAAERARAAGVAERCHFVHADLTAPAFTEAVPGPFDLVLDFGTLDDLRPAGRRAMAAHIARLARPGAVVLFWCFHARREDLPRISFHGPSRLAPALEPGEEQELFAQDFHIETFARPHPHVACFLLRRRPTRAGPSAAQEPAIEAR
jgi:SAM-dependent methyltransferase